jgi:hypothetical protein
MQHHVLLNDLTFKQYGLRIRAGLRKLVVVRGGDQVFC